MSAGSCQNIKVGDFQIRKSVSASLAKKYSRDPETVVINELGLCQGVSRIDLAVINGKIHGIEIKSEKDTLDRLPSQIEIYSKCLDSITVVAATCHIRNLKGTLPKWCGLVEAIPNGSQIKLKSIRKEKKNPKLDKNSLVQLIWKDEALRILSAYGEDGGVKYKPREQAWKKIVSLLTMNELRNAVIFCLKNRSHWRFEGQQKSSGG